MAFVGRWAPKWATKQRQNDDENCGEKKSEEQEETIVTRRLAPVERELIAPLGRPSAEFTIYLPPLAYLLRGPRQFCGQIGQMKLDLCSLLICARRDSAATPD